MTPDGIDELLRRVALTVGDHPISGVKRVLQFERRPVTRPLRITSFVDWFTHGAT